MLKNTAHRQIIIKILASTKEHPSADEIFRKALEELPYITKPTVYNTLKKLEEKGEIQKLHISDKELRYDWNTEFHPHLLCTSCGRVIDLDPRDFKQQLSNYIVEHAVEKIELNFYGLCDKCKLTKGGDDGENK